MASFSRQDWIHSKGVLTATRAGALGSAGKGLLASNVGRSVGGAGGNLTRLGGVSTTKSGMKPRTLTASSAASMDAGCASGAGVGARSGAVGARAAGVGDAGVGIGGTGVDAGTGNLAYNEHERAPNAAVEGKSSANYQSSNPLIGLEGTESGAAEDLQSVADEMRAPTKGTSPTFEELADRYPLNPTTCYYPLYIVQGLTARKISRLIPHEEALGLGLLRKVLRVEDGKFSNRVLILEPTKKGAPVERIFDTDLYFMSHRWLSPSLNVDEAHPDDPDNSKLRALCRIVEKRKFFWFDFLCIPQRNPDLQLRAIQSLPFYTHCSARFRSLHYGAEGKDVYLSRLWCQAEIISSKLPVRMPHFNAQWLSGGLRGTMFDIRPFDGKGFHTPEAHRESPVSISLIQDLTDCQLTNPQDMRKILPLLNFAIKEFEELLAWDALDSGTRRKLRTFGAGIYRIDDDPMRAKMKSGGVTTSDIRALISKLRAGVEGITKKLQLFELGAAAAD